MQGHLAATFPDVRLVILMLNVVAWGAVILFRTTCKHVERPFEDEDKSQ